MSLTLDRVTELLAAVRDRHVGVVGDVMLDRFVMGKVERISPEAPVPVVHVRSEEERLGGAANVAANGVALGARVSLFGVVGPGSEGERLRGRVTSLGVDASGLVSCPDRVTTVKTRILAGQQQVVRIDRETNGSLADATREEFLARLSDAGHFDAIIVSDYGKGVVDEPLMARLREQKQRGVLVVVDPKQGNFELYRELTCITPNEREAAFAQHDRIENDTDAVRVGRGLGQRLKTDLLLLTRGEHGMTLFEPDGQTHLPTEARHVFDVTGAGDTVIASFTSFLASGAKPVEAARLANLAAGLTVAELGTAVVTGDDLRRGWQRWNAGDRDAS